MAAEVVGGDLGFESHLQPSRWKYKPSSDRDLGNMAELVVFRDAVRTKEREQEALPWDGGPPPREPIMRDTW